MFRKILFVISMIALFTLSACSGTTAPSGPLAVSIKKIQGAYYQVDLNLDQYSHSEVGRQYAAQIKQNAPDFEARVDAYLYSMEQILGIDLATVKNRAFDISQNIPPEYMDEIRGMQSVFSYDTDKLGDGRLSKNEMSLYTGM